MCPSRVSASGFASFAALTASLAASLGYAIDRWLPALPEGVSETVLHRDDVGGNASVAHVAVRP